MEQVPDLSKFSEEEQRILRDVMSRAQDEEEKDRKDFRKEEKALSILESAVLLRQREKSDVDLTTTCNICFQTKFADGVGHICETCHTRCCARCGVKVIKSNKKLWLCVLCRKKKELAYKFSKYLKSDAAAKSWGRSRSLEEEASSRRLATTPLSAMTRRFPSALNITAPFFGNKEQQQNQPNVRSDPLPPRRDLPYQQSTPQPRSTHLRSSPPPHNPPHHQQYHQQDQQQQQQLSTHRYTRRRSSLDTIRNDSLSSDQSENPPTSAPRPKPRKGNNGGAHHRYRRSGSSGSEDEARSSPSSCQDSESDRVSVRKERRPAVRENRWLRSQEELTTSVSDFFEVIATHTEMHAPTGSKAPSVGGYASVPTSCDRAALPRDLETALRQFASDRNVAVLFDNCQDNRTEDQFDIVGRNVAMKLRALPKRQRLIAEKLINETLFEAELGTLNRNSKINVL